MLEEGALRKATWKILEGWCVCALRLERLYSWVIMDWVLKRGDRKEYLDISIGVVEYSCRLKEGNR